jgi:hypothetical protein
MFLTCLGELVSSRALPRAGVEPFFQTLWCHSPHKAEFSAEEVKEPMGFFRANVQWHHRISASPLPPPVI